MRDNCQITVKAVDQSLDNHDGCQGVIGKDNWNNFFKLHESQVAINMCIRIYIEMIAVIKDSEAIPFRGCSCSKSGEQVHTAKYGIHPDNARVPTSIPNRPCHLIHFVLGVWGCWKRREPLNVCQMR